METSQTQYARKDNGAATPDPYEIADIGDFLASASTSAKAYLEAEREFLLLTGYQQVAKLLGNLLITLLAGLMITGALLFSSIALAIWLGTLVASTALGFVIVGGIYLVAFLAFWFIWRVGMKQQFALGIINSFYDDKD